MFVSKPLLTKFVNSGGRILYDSLIRNNVKDVFVYSGGSVMPLIDSLYKSDINYFVNSHEQNTGHSATGYAKSSDRTGVCMVTSGPGITNMITPILDAKNDSTPLVVFSGQVSLEALGKNSFQEAPSVMLTQHITKWSHQIKDIHEIESVVDRAFSIANEGKKGPVHIDIPKCISYQNYEPKLSEMYRKQNIKTESTNNMFICEEKIKHVADIINKSKQPIIMLGQGCYGASSLLGHFAVLSDIPVASTIHGCGIFDENHDLSLRWCGMHGSAAANYAIQQSDLIIALGSRFDDRTTGNINYYAPEAIKASNNGTGGIIHVNIEKKELNFVVESDYNFNTDCSLFLKSIIPFIKSRKRNTWTTHISSLKSKYPFLLKKDKKNLHMEDVLDVFNTKTQDKNVIFTAGVGNHQMQAYQFIKSQYPKKIISSGSLGVMGTGLPYSIGTQIANPDKLVIDIDGDSSFNMTLNDLKTIKEYKLPIKIVVMNNNAQMMVSVWEQLYFGERYTATLNNNNPDYASLARSFGIRGIRCNNRKYLEETITHIIEYDGPILCEFQIEKDICLPLVGPGNALDDMLLPEEQNYKKIYNLSNGLAPS